MTKEMKNIVRAAACLVIIYLAVCGVLLFMDEVVFMIYRTYLLPLELSPVAAVGVLALFAFGIWAAGRQGQSAEDRELAKDNDNWIYVAVGLGAVLLVAAPLVILLIRFY